MVTMARQLLAAEMTVLQILCSNDPIRIQAFQTHTHTRLCCTRLGSRIQRDRRSSRTLLLPDIDSSILGCG